jgi:lathosterol oxidase
VRSGLLSLAVTVAVAVAYMALLEPHTPYYGFFETHAWNWAWGVAGCVAYVAAFDTHFYWSHWLLHESEYLWNNIHYFHHGYKEPSAFAQFAVHPVEAFLQGPFGHFFVQLFFPVHPVQLAALGFLSSAYAFAAHDGRFQAATNNHWHHHTKGRGRRHYFNLGFLTSFWDRVMGTRWHPEHPLWLEWEAQRQAGVLADTRDGTREGVSNDVFGARLDDGGDSSGGARRRGKAA